MSWKQLSSREVYRNKWMWVTEDQVETVLGKKLTYGVVHKDPYALVIPWDGERFTLVGQYRYPVDRFSWELPQGMVSGVSVDEAAAIELQEETGFQADTIKYVARFHIANGHHTQVCHVYVATGLAQGEPDREESEEGMKVKGVTFDELKGLVADGTIQDGPTLAAIGMMLVNEWIDVVSF